MAWNSLIDFLLRWMMCCSEQYDDAALRIVRRGVSLTVGCGVSSNW